MAKESIFTIGVDLMVKTMQKAALTEEQIIYYRSGKSGDASKLEEWDIYGN